MTVPMCEALPLSAGTAGWSVWGTTARLVVTEPDRLLEARALVTAQLDAIDHACSRFREDSEVRNLQRSIGRPVRVSPLLAELLSVALRAARRTDGDVDPTIGGAMVRLGYDADRSPVTGAARKWLVRRRPAPGWRLVGLDGNKVTLPDGVLLDLGATAKAFAADRCARLVAERCDTGVLINLGGDIATAGPAPDGGWRVPVTDRAGEAHFTITLPAGTAVATSCTASQRWNRDGRPVQHILDPRTCRPARGVWRTVSVLAGRCVDANTLSTAAVVRGNAALPWLTRLGAAARLVTTDGRVRRIGQWPVPGPTVIEPKPVGTRSWAAAGRVAHQLG